MTVEGYDVSHWQSKTPNLTGKGFLFARATYGASVDDMYAVHQGNVRTLYPWVVMGAYHFGRPVTTGDTVAEQVSSFLLVAAHADLLALDLEPDGSHGQMTRTDARRFIAAVHARGRKIGLYHSESGFPSTLRQDWDWVAKWGLTPPAAGWTFWQYTDHPIDRDRFNGTLAELKQLAFTPPDTGTQSWTLHVANGARVRVYRLGAKNGPDGRRCILDWSDDVWSASDSTARTSPPVHRTTCDGKSGATTTLVLSGAYKGGHVQLEASHGVTVTPPQTSASPIS